MYANYAIGKDVQAMKAVVGEEALSSEVREGGWGGTRAWGEGVDRGERAVRVDSGE